MPQIRGAICDQGSLRSDFEIVAESGRRRVVVVGGGVAGMTAAHELALRGFEVRVFEKRDIPGGKARSMPVPHTARGERKPLPGEHGFRFFPGFYRHLPDTLARIPYDRGSSVAERLVPVNTMTFAFSHRPPFVLPARFPRTLREAGYVLGFFRAVGELGISIDDLVFTWWKLWEILTSCEERRLAELERRSWWEFMDADARSQPFRELLVIGLTRNLVASRAESANARTVGQVGIQLLRDLLTPGKNADRILDGPTNDVWIGPWLLELQARGVDYQLGWELERVNLAPGGQRIASVVLRRWAPDGPRLGNTLAHSIAEQERRRARRADASAQHCREISEALGEAHRLEQAEHQRALEQGRPPETETLEVGADEFVFALPVEVMGALLERQPELVRAAPSLSGVRELGKHHVAWMNGIQFYLTEEVALAPGHINHVDSPWALTTISQSQFWPRFPSSGFGDGGVKTVISVDISAWDGVGSHGKEAFDSDFREVADETWRQLKVSLNHEAEVLRDGMLHPECPWHIDADLAERIDKERVLSAEHKAHRALHKLEPHNGEPDLLTNAEPLLVNLADSWQLRPEVHAELENLTLAADYVRTHTNLATMEAANEAARRAVNVVLERAGSTAERCEIWPLEEPCAGLRERDRAHFAEGLAWRNPRHVDWFVKRALVAVATLLRVLAFFAALPGTLYLLMFAIGGALVVFGRHYDEVWSSAFRAACELASRGDAAFVPATCVGDHVPVPSAPARATFWFAAYLVCFGAGLYLMPKKALRMLGFPTEQGPWTPILGATPLLMATLYATAALFELRPFFWLSVVGRLGVFLYVIHLTQGKLRGSTLLILVALPDAWSAVWTGYLLAPHPAAGFVLACGLVNVVVAFAFRLFPAGMLKMFGFPEQAGAWVPMASALLFFWGVYEALAVLFGLVPLYFASVVCRVLFGLTGVIAPLAYRQRAEPFVKGWRLGYIGAAYLASAYAIWRALGAAG